MEGILKRIILIDSVFVERNSLIDPQSSRLNITDVTSGIGKDLLHPAKLTKKLSVDDRRD